MTFKGKPNRHITDYHTMRDVCHFDKNGYTEVPDAYVQRMKDAGFEEVKLFMCECGKPFESHTARLTHWKKCEVHKKAAAEKKAKK